MEKLIKAAHKVERLKTEKTCGSKMGSEDLLVYGGLGLGMLFVAPTVMGLGAFAKDKAKAGIKNVLSE